MIAALLWLALWHGSIAPAEPRAPEPAQLIPETVRITVPAAVDFDVDDVAVSHLGANGPSTVSFILAVLNLGRVLRISVKADADLTPPSGPAIPASSLSWQTSNVLGGVGVNGVLSKTSYTQVFQGHPLAVAGRVDLTWTLSAPGTAIRAGTHQVLLRWKVESVIP
jgi:hypothetical protein